MGVLYTSLPFELSEQLATLSTMQQDVLDTFKALYPVGSPLYWTTWQTMDRCTIHQGIIETVETFGTDPYSWHLNVRNNKSLKLNIVKLSNRPVTP